MERRKEKDRGREREREREGREGGMVLLFIECILHSCDYSRCFSHMAHGRFTATLKGRYPIISNAIFQIS